MEIQVKKHTWSIVIIIFFISTLARGIVASHMGNYLTYGDELLHTSIAKSIASGYGLSVRGELFNHKECLYSLVIAPIFFFIKNMNVAHSTVMWVNAALMSSSVFPIYFIAKKFLQQKKFVYLAIIYALLIGEMNYSMQVLQENLNYPLVMWFFLAFICWVIQDSFNFWKITGIGVFAFILSLCKAMNLIVVVAVLLYFLIQMVLNKNICKQIIYKTLVYLVSFLFCKILYDSIINWAFSNIVSGDSVYNTALSNLLNFELLIQLVYPAIIYILFTILVTGIVPLPLLIGNWKKNNNDSNNLLIFVLSFIFVAIATICILIVTVENLSSLSIRFHSRYYFYTFIAIFILFLHLCENKTMYTNSDKKRTIIIFSAWISFILIMPSIIFGSSIDNAGICYMRYFSQNEYLLTTIKCLLIILSFVIIYLLLKNNIKVLLIITCIILTIGIVSGQLYFFSIAPRKMITQEVDALLFNNYLDVNEQGDWNDGEQILIIEPAQTYNNFAFEVYLSEPYHFCFSNVLTVGNDIDFSTLSYFVYNCYVNNPNAIIPKYIISSMVLTIQGYDEVNIDMQNFHLYKKNEELITEEPVKLLYIEDGIYPDRWLNEKEAVMRFAGSDYSNNANLLITVDNWLIGGDLNVNYVDSTGYTGEFVIPYSQDKISIEIPIHKLSEETAYTIRLIPDRAVNPNNGDPRLLSFRLFDAQIISEK